MLLFGVNPSPSRCFRQTTKFHLIRYDILIDFSKGSRLANFWARKSTAILEQEAAQGDDGSDTQVPKRALSALNLVGLGIGGTIGAGIFVLTGHAAAANAGPGGHAVLLLGAVACAFAGLCYAEMSSTSRSAAALTLMPMRPWAS